MATKKIDPTVFNDFMEENRRTMNEMKKEIKSLKKIIKDANINESRDSKGKKSKKGTRSLTGYNLFQKEKSSEINDKVADFEPSDEYMTKAKDGKEPKQMTKTQYRFKIGSQMWKDLSEEERIDFNTRAKNHKKEEKSIDVDDIVDEAHPKKYKKKESKKDTKKSTKKVTKKQEKDSDQDEESDKYESSKDESSSSSVEVDSDDSESSDSE